jgi:hypothetical protein
MKIERTDERCKCFSHMNKVLSKGAFKYNKYTLELD